MTVRLSRNHHLGREYADNAQHRIYFGKEGEELNEDEDTPSSKTFSGLEVGQIYCAKVEFFLYGKPIGVPSCVRCELIPAQSTTEKTVKITSLVVGGIVLFIVPIIFYLLIFQRRKIKKLLKPYEIVILCPDGPTLNGLHDLLLFPSEEPCDVVSSVVPAASSALS